MVFERWTMAVVGRTLRNKIPNLIFYNGCGAILKGADKPSILCPSITSTPKDQITMKFYKPIPISLAAFLAVIAVPTVFSVAISGIVLEPELSIEWVRRYP